MIKERSAQHSTDVLVDEKVNERAPTNVCEYYWASLLLEGGYSCIMCGFLMTNVKVAITVVQNKIDLRRHQCFWSVL